jgi:hypothetical protein
MNLSIEEPANKVTTWCNQHGVMPAKGRVAADTQPRTLRCYRTLALMDASTSGGGFSQTHDFNACLDLLHSHF